MGAACCILYTAEQLASEMKAAVVPFSCALASLHPPDTHTHAHTLICAVPYGVPGAVHVQ